MKKEKLFYKLSDQVIGQVRELLQLSLLTNTSIVDHLRAITLEQGTGTSLVLSEDYVAGWNSMADQLYKEAEDKMKEMQKLVESDSTDGSVSN